MPTTIVCVVPLDARAPIVRNIEARGARADCTLAVVAAHAADARQRAAVDATVLRTAPAASPKVALHVHTFACHAASRHTAPLPAGVGLALRVAALLGTRSLRSARGTCRSRWNNGQLGGSGWGVSENLRHVPEPVCEHVDCAPPRGRHAARVTEPGNE
jgi:hypothetical protein